MGKGKYEQWRTELGLGRIEEWCGDGITDEELARTMHISASTLYEWLKRFPEISEAVTRGRGGALVQIKNALFERAKGGTHAEIKAVKLRRREFDAKTGRCVAEEEYIDYAREEKYFPPDTNAIKFWLTNRDPEHWSNKVELEGGGTLRLEDAL